MIKCMEYGYYCDEISSFEDINTFTVENSKGMFDAEDIQNIVTEYSLLLLEVLAALKKSNNIDLYKDTTIPKFEDFPYRLNEIASELIEKESYLFSVVEEVIPSNIEYATCIALGIELAPDIEEDDFDSLDEALYSDCCDYFVLGSDKLAEYFSLIENMSPEEKYLHHHTYISSLIDSLLANWSTTFTHDGCFYILTYFDYQSDSRTPIWDLSLIPVYQEINLIIDEEIAQLKQLLYKVVA